MYHPLKWALYQHLVKFTAKRSLAVDNILLDVMPVPNKPGNFLVSILPDEIDCCIVDFASSFFNVGDIFLLFPIEKKCWKHYS